MRTAPTRNQIIRLRVSTAEKELIQQAATVAQVAVSELLRVNVLAAANKLSNGL